MLGDPIKVRFDPETEARLRSYSEAADRPMAGIVRTAVREALSDGYTTPPGPWEPEGMPDQHGLCSVSYLRSPAWPEGGHEIRTRFGDQVRVYPDDRHSAQKRRRLITLTLTELASVRYQAGRTDRIDFPSYIAGRLQRLGLRSEQIEIIDRTGR